MSGRVNVQTVEDNKDDKIVALRIIFLSKSKMYAVEKLRYALCNLLDVPGILVGLRVRISHVSAGHMSQHTTRHQRGAQCAAVSADQWRGPQR